LSHSTVELLKDLPEGRGGTRGGGNVTPWCDASA
jgi:hypothetical protein